MRDPGMLELRDEPDRLLTWGCRNEFDDWYQLEEEASVKEAEAAWQGVMKVCLLFDKCSTQKLQRQVLCSAFLSSAFKYHQLHHSAVHLTVKQ